jgi:thioesterase domain-containing protein
MLSRSKPSDEGIAQKKLLAELLLQSNRIEIYPASLAQQRLWFLDQLEAQSSAYNVHLGFWLRGPLDLDALKASLQELLNRHASLRTSFRLEGSELVQVITHGLRLEIPITTVTGSGNLYPEAYEIAQQEVEAPFDLQKSPLFRARILRVTPEDHVLLCTLHHIVTDSWSMQILAKELAALYTAFSSHAPSPLPELPINYGDYSEWQRKWLTSEKVQQQLTFWKNELEDAPPVLELRMQRPRSPEQTFSGASQTVPISDEIISALKALSVRLKATPFMLLLAAFKILLYRASAQADLLVGVPVAGRNPIETEGLVGFFVNTLVLRTDLFGNRPFSDLVAQVRETTVSAFANADVPFENVVEVLQPERNLSYNPIFQVMFSVIRSAVQSQNFGNMIAFPYVVSPRTSIFDLSMTVIEGLDGQWWAELDYNTDLFGSQDIAAILSSYTNLLQAIVDSPDSRILDFPLADGMPAVTAQQSARSIRSARQPADAVSASTRPRRSEEPLDREEELLVGIWKKLLRLHDVGIDDNFFDVGGHSLLAAQLIAQVRSTTARQIGVSAIFRAPTIRTFAQLLREDALAKPDPIVMKLKDGSGAVSFFAVAAPQVDTFGFAQLARYLPADQSMYKLQAPDPIVRGRPLNPEETRALAKNYIAGMKAAQPHGPYCLGAMCGGVVIAQEMVLQLEAQGEEIVFFAIFDTWVLENSQVRFLWAIDYYLERFRSFRASPLLEKYDTVRRFFNLSAALSEPDPLTGWKGVYWPDEDFKPPQFRAPVLLFKRPRQPYFYIRDPYMGWASRSTSGVTICEIDCGHVEMLREPFVQMVGSTLEKRLQSAAQQRETQSSASNSSGDLHGDLDPGTWANSVA